MWCHWATMEHRHGIPSHWIYSLWKTTPLKIFKTRSLFENTSWTFQTSSLFADPETLVLLRQLGVWSDDKLLGRKFQDPWYQKHGYHWGPTISTADSMMSSQRVFLVPRLIKCLFLSWQAFYLRRMCSNIQGTYWIGRRRWLWFEPFDECTHVTFSDRRRIHPWNGTLIT
jgi:hypothetical protein